MTCHNFRCCEIKTDPKIILSERQSKFELINTQRKNVSKIAFDGCVDYRYSGKRCDFILYLENERKSVMLFIELKGNDILKAIKQLEDSIAFFKNQIESPVYAYAITSRSPMTSSEIQNEKMRLRKKHIIFDTKNKIMTKNYAEYENLNKK